MHPSQKWPCKYRRQEVGKFPTKEHKFYKIYVIIILTRSIFLLLWPFFIFPYRKRVFLIYKDNTRWISQMITEFLQAFWVNFRKENATCQFDLIGGQVVTQWGIRQVLPFSWCGIEVRRSLLRVPYFGITT